MTGDIRGLLFALLLILAVIYGGRWEDKRRLLKQAKALAGSQGSGGGK